MILHAWCHSRYGTEVDTNTAGGFDGYFQRPAAAAAAAAATSGEKLCASSQCLDILTFLSEFRVVCDRHLHMVSAFHLFR